MWEGRSIETRVITYFISVVLLNCNDDTVSYQMLPSPSGFSFIYYLYLNIWNFLLTVVFLNFLDAASSTEIFPM
jgi:hypothetical protein